MRQHKFLSLCMALIMLMGLAAPSASAVWEGAEPVSQTRGVLLSAAAPQYSITVYTASRDTVVISSTSTYGTQSDSLRYSPSEGLVLNGFDGGPIFSDGDLTLTVEAPSSVSGIAGAFSGRAITAGGAMTLNNGGGKLLVTASVYDNAWDTTLYGSAIKAGMVTLDGDYDVRGNCANADGSYWYWGPNAYAVGADTVTLRGSGVVSGGTYTVEQDTYYGMMTYAVCADTVVMSGSSRIVGGGYVYVNSVDTEMQRGAIGAHSLTLTDNAAVTGVIGSLSYGGNNDKIIISGNASVHGAIQSNYDGTVSISGSPTITGCIGGGDITIDGTPTITGKADRYGWGSLIRGRTVRVNADHLSLSAAGNNGCGIGASAVYITGDDVSVSGRGTYAGIEAYNYLEISGDNAAVTGGSSADGDAGPGIRGYQMILITGDGATIIGGNGGNAGGAGIDAQSGNGGYSDGNWYYNRPVYIEGDRAKISGGNGKTGNGGAGVLITGASSQQLSLYGAGIAITGGNSISGAGGDGVMLRSNSANTYQHVTIEGVDTTITGGSSQTGAGGRGVGYERTGSNYYTYVDIRGNGTAITGGSSQTGLGGIGIDTYGANFYARATVKGGGGYGVYGVCTDTDTVSFSYTADGTTIEGAAPAVQNRRGTGASEYDNYSDRSVTTLYNAEKTKLTVTVNDAEMYLYGNGVTYTYTVEGDTTAYEAELVVKVTGRYGDQVDLEDHIFEREGFVQMGWKWNRGDSYIGLRRGMGYGLWGNQSFYAAWLPVDDHDIVLSTDYDYISVDGENYSDTYQVVHDTDKAALTLPAALYYQDGYSHSYQTGQDTPSYAERPIAAWMEMKTAQDGTNGICYLPGRQVSAVNGARMFKALHASEYLLAYYPNGGSVAAGGDLVLQSTVGEWDGHTGVYTVQDDTSFTAPSGKAFKGWATSADGDVTYQPGDKVSANDLPLNLYAVWGSGEVGVTVEDVEVLSGETVSVPVYVSTGGASTPLRALHMEINIPKESFETPSVVGLAGASTTYDTGKENTLIIAYASVQTLPTSPLFTLELAPKMVQTRQTIRLAIKEIKINGISIADQTLTVTVDPSFHASARVSYYFGESKPVSGVAIQMGNRNAETGSDGSASFTAISSETVTPVFTKDGFGARGITANDASRILQYQSYYNRNLNSLQLLAADADGSGEVDEMDAACILSKIAGKPELAGAVGTWKFTDATGAEIRTVAMSAEGVEVSVTAILIGDVDGNWQP